MQSGLRYAVDIIPTGFSTAIRSQSANAKCMKKTIASYRLLYRRLAALPYFPMSNHELPVTVRYVHGGCAISKSHLPTSCSTPSMVIITPPFRAASASPSICHSGCPPDGSIMSQLYASCPFARNAFHTVWLSSQAIRTFIQYTLLNQLVVPSPVKKTAFLSSSLATFAPCFSMLQRVSTSSATARRLSHTGKFGL